jgi:hypothetical protein
MTKNAFLFGKIKEELLELRARCMEDLKGKVKHHLRGMKE